MTAAVAGGAGGALVVTCSILRSISRVGKGSKSVGGALVVILQWHGVVIPAHAEGLAEAQRRRRPVTLINYVGNVNPEML